MTTPSKKEIAIPLSLLVGLLGNVGYQAHQDGRAAQRQESFEARVDERHQQIIARLDKHESMGERVNKLTTDVFIVQRDFDRLEREIRLLRDYTEGRVGHLPYRKE